MSTSTSLEVIFIVEGGQRCRLVEREHPRDPGRLLLEVVIEVEP